MGARFYNTKVTMWQTLKNGIHGNEINSIRKEGPYYEGVSNENLFFYSTFLHCLLQTL